MPTIKVIDLFAGPGGLGEGFSSFKDSDGKPVFNLIASIEKEKSAHRTLQLRAFVRTFGNNIPEDYYKFLKGEKGIAPEDELYKKKQFSSHIKQAKLEALNLTLGEDDKEIYKAISESLGKDESILIGGPPCQAFSGAGRSRNVGNIGYKIENDPRSHLYKEYLKVIARFQPLVFVMENVKGMLSAKLNGEKVFEHIRNDLQKPCKTTGMKPEKGRKSHEYTIVSLSQPLDINKPFDPHDFIVESERYGIPQQRHRVILLGIRSDIEQNWNKDLILSTDNSPPNIEMLLGDLPKIRSGLSARSKIKNTDTNWISSIQKVKNKVIPSLRSIGYSSVADKMEYYSELITVPKNGQGSSFGLSKTSNETCLNDTLHNWLIDQRLELKVCNYESRSHIVSDLHRYLFCSSWAKVMEEDKSLEVISPRSKHYPKALVPNHKNFSTGKFADRFRVQASSGIAKTITSHISKDGHSFIHYDPLQCRSLTVREAARIQSFPDNYFFVGNRTEQYVQVGNAVPPFLAHKIANIVYKLII